MRGLDKTSLCLEVNTSTDELKRAKQSNNKKQNLVSPPKRLKNLGGRMSKNTVDVKDMEYIGEIRERRVYAHFEKYWHTEETGSVKNTFKANILGKWCGPDCNCPYYEAVRISDNKKNMIKKEKDGTHRWGERPEPPIIW